MNKRGGNKMKEIETYMLFFGGVKCITWLHEGAIEGHPKGER